MSSMSVSAPNVFQSFPNQHEPHSEFSGVGQSHPDCTADASLIALNSSVEETLTFRLNQFRLQGVGCDVQFIVGDEGERLYAHKLVLGCSSAVFNAMFYGPLGSLKNGAAEEENGKQEVDKPMTVPRSENITIPRMVVDDRPQSAFINSSSVSSSSTNCFSSSNFSSFEEQGGKNVQSVGKVNNSLAEEVEEEVDEEVDDEEVAEGDDGEEEGDTTAERPDTTTMLTAGSFSPFLSSFFQPHLSSASPPTKMARKLNTNGGTTKNDQKHRPLYFEPKWYALGANSANGGNEGESRDGKPSRESINETAAGVETIHIPDCTPTAFRIMIQYLYSDRGDFKSEAVINDDNVMQTLYAAKKYDIRPLVTECVRYLLAGLNASNAACLLAQARLFQEETLLKRCFHTIDTQTDTALESESFADVDRETLVEILGRSRLDPSSELVIFYAAQRWAEAECERRDLPSTVENLRECLGPALHLIRFPLMNVQEFGQAGETAFHLSLHCFGFPSSVYHSMEIIASSALLNCEEIAEVFLTLTVKPRPQCRYPCGFRSGSRSKHVVNRFTSLSSKRCTRRENKICFTADHDIYVAALGIYGMAPNTKPHSIAYIEDKMPIEWSCQVEIMVASVVDPNTYGSSLCHMASATMLLHGRMRDHTPCQASFDEPILCKANTTYVASIRFISENGVQTFCGKDGQESIAVDLPYDETVTFKFSSYRNSYGNDDGGKAEGQIPSLSFLVEWPDRS